MAGAGPADLVYSNPVKRREDVRFAARLGVDLFVVDSPGEVAKVAEAAPGSGVLCRLVTSGDGSDWPLSRKYGCSTGEAIAILRAAARLGLRAEGISFHVGSQQRDPEAWAGPIAAAAAVFEALREDGPGPVAARHRRRLPGPARRRLPAPGGVRRRDRPAPGRGVRRPPADHDRRARPRDRRRRRRPGHHAWSGSCTAPAPAGSSSTPASSPGWWRPSTRRSATRWPPTSPAPPARACSPARPATAPTSSTRTSWSSCRWRWPRATRSGSTAPASTPRRTRPSASTASPRSPSVVRT